LDGDDFVDEIAVFENLCSDEDDDFEDMIKRCDCPNWPTHKDTCEFSPYNLLNSRIQSDISDEFIIRDDSVKVNDDVNLEEASMVKSMVVVNAMEKDKNIELMEVVETNSRKPCKCGSFTHSRTSHKDCCFNKKRKLDADMQIDDCPVASKVLKEEKHQCTCGNKIRGHHRRCPQNSRIKYKLSTTKRETDDDCVYNYKEGPKPLSVSTPPTVEWLKLATMHLRDTANEPVVFIDDEPGEVVGHREISPLLCHKINGDGNCFFRAVSKAVAGSQKYHMVVRSALCQFMLDNSHVFAPQLPEYHVDSSLGTVERYLSNRKMLDCGIWGTDIEILAAATFFQINIHVSSLGAGLNRAWFKFEPLFKGGSMCLKTSNVIDICLFHSNSKNHYDLVCLK
jgi:hypothetical protein